MKNLFKNKLLLLCVVATGLVSMTAAQAAKDNRLWSSFNMTGIVVQEDGKITNWPMPAIPPGTTLAAKPSSGDRPKVIQYGGCAFIVTAVPVAQRIDIAAKPIGGSSKAKCFLATTRTDKAEKTAISIDMSEGAAPPTALYLIVKPIAATK